MTPSPGRRLEPEALSASELQSLSEVARGRLHQRQISAADRERLLEAGYIERKFGGLQATTVVHAYVVAHRA